MEKEATLNGQSPVLTISPLDPATLPYLRDYQLHSLLQTLKCSVFCFNKNSLPLKTVKWITMVI